jgi:predicted Zn-dependent peptidase
MSNSFTAKMASIFRKSHTSRNTRYQTRYKTLKNGLGLHLVSFPGVKTVSLRCFVFVGSVYETRENSGISHFLEHMLFRGNEKLGDATTMSIKMEELGGEFNAATSFDQTEFWLDVHLDYLDQGIERFCQFLQFPLYEQLETERSIILEEILGDYNDENSLIDLDSLTSNLLWPNHSMGMPIIGTVDTVKKITKTDLKNWHRIYYTPSNMILGITGDIDLRQIKDVISAQFITDAPNRIDKYPQILAKPLPGKQISLVSDKDNQFSIQWSFPVYELTRNLRVQYELLQRILDGGNSSRLQRLIREEKGLVYDISLDTTYFETGMIMSVQSVVGTSRLTELVNALVELIGELIKKGITDQELKMAKVRYKAALECNNDTAQGILYDSLMPKLNPSGVGYKEILPVLSEVSTGLINSTLKLLFDQNLSTFVLVGPWGDAEKEMLHSKLQPWISGRNIS